MLPSISKIKMVHLNTSNQCRGREMFQLHECSLSLPQILIHTHIHHLFSCLTHTHTHSFTVIHVQHFFYLSYTHSLTHNHTRASCTVLHHVAIPCRQGRYPITAATVAIRCTSRGSLLSPCREREPTDCRANLPASYPSTTAPVPTRALCQKTHPPHPAYPGIVLGAAGALGGPRSA